MRVKTQKIINEFIVIPTFGWINERYYYGYPVIAIAFAWLCYGDYYCEDCLDMHFRKAVEDIAK